MRKFMVSVFVALRFRGPGLGFRVSGLGGLCFGFQVRGREVYKFLIFSCSVSIGRTL